MRNIPSKTKGITDFVRKIYLAYFIVMFGGQDKPWARRIVCKACVESLRKWVNGTLKILGLVCRWLKENQITIAMSVFCLVDLKGFNRLKKRLEITPI